MRMAARRLPSYWLPLVAAVLLTACTPIPEAMPGAPIDEKLLALSELADEQSTAGDGEMAFLMRYTLLRYAVEHQDELRQVDGSERNSTQSLLLATHKGLSSMPEGSFVEEGALFSDGRELGPSPDALLEELKWFFADVTPE